MDSVTFDEVESIFHNGCIWSNGYEMYWYRHAWDILTELGATNYDNELERAQIILYAATIVHVYFTFSNYAFYEGCDLTGMEIIDYCLPEVAIGQIAASCTSNGCLLEDVEYAFQEIFSTFKFKVFKTLSQKMNVIDVFVWMYSTGIQLKDFEEVASEDEQCNLLEEVDFVPENYEHFSGWIEKNSYRIFEEAEDEIALADAYDYVSTIMS